uniref:Uncharacterized protein n=1 Tax=Arundo donax TaxID=35708 RepID=A0A0A8Z1V3_ARUDO
MFSTASICRFPRTGDMCPSNWFESNSSTTNRDMFEKDDGMAPVKKLLLSVTFCRFVRVPSHSGTTPIN